MKEKVIIHKFLHKLSKTSKNKIIYYILLYLIKCF